METVDNLIVGCGISGITLANLLAERGEKVLVIDAKSHIGGNCYDYKANGITVHQYGTHIFHTNLANVWHYLSRFTSWYPYMHCVRGLIDGQTVPIPFNLNSIDAVFPAQLAAVLTEKLINQFGFNVKVPILKLREAKDKDLEFLADYIYEKVFLHYTLKQWGLKPEELNPAVTGRVPVYVSRDNRYFQDKYQGIPAEGYTKMMQKMLAHPFIEVRLNTPFQQIKQSLSWKRLFYTGPIDEFFEYKYGELPYRSIRLDFVRYNKPYFQDGSVINYPCNYDFTRIGEYKYFLDERTDETIVSYEYPQAFCREKNERYYPIVKTENLELYQKYLAEVKNMPNTYFLGRLGDYQYYDMDKAIQRAMDLLLNVLGPQEI